MIDENRRVQENRCHLSIEGLFKTLVGFGTNLLDIGRAAAR